MVRPEKKETVKIIKEKFERSKEVILTDYRGLNVKEITDLRSKLRKSGIEYKVYKNTLAKIAIDKGDFQEASKYLEGPTAFAFDYDNEVEAAKILTDFAKDNKNMEVKGGVIEGEVVDVEVVKQYASLPSRDELIAKALGSMNAPVQQITTVIAAPLQSLINVIRAKTEKAS